MVEEQANYDTRNYSHDAYVYHAQEWVHCNANFGREFGRIHNNHENAGKLLERKETDYYQRGTIDFWFQQVR